MAAKKTDKSMPYVAFNGRTAEILFRGYTVKKDEKDLLTQIKVQYRIQGLKAYRFFRRIFDGEFALEDVRVIISNGKEATNSLFAVCDDSKNLLHYGTSIYNNGDDIVNKVIMSSAKCYKKGTDNPSRYIKHIADNRLDVSSENIKILGEGSFSHMTRIARTLHNFVTI